MKTVKIYNYFSHISKKTSVKVFFCICVILCMSFIFSRSLKAGETSNKESDRVIEITSDVLGSVSNISVDVNENTRYIIRKLAHLIEYAALGSLSLASFALLIGRNIYSLVAALFFSFGVSCADEFFQTLTQGRSGNFKDVAIDICGVMSAIIIMVIVFIVIRSRYKKHIKQIGG